MSQQTQTTAAMASLTLTDVDDDFVLVQPEQRIGLPGGPEFRQSEGRQWADEILQVLEFCELPLDALSSAKLRARTDIARGIVANMVLEKAIAVEEITPHQDLFNFMLAGFKGDVKSLKDLLSKYDLPAPDDSPMVHKFNDFYNQGQPRGALFMAVRKGHVDAVAVILDSVGTAINMRDKDGRTLVCHATESKQVEVLRLLLSRGARDVMARDGMTALHRFGASEAHEREVRVLIEHGGDVNALKSNGEPDLYCHAAGGNEAGVKQLLKLGANPSTRTSCRWSSLHWAANSGHLNIVKLLVEAGASVNNRSDTGVTPLDLIDRQGHVTDDAHGEVLALTRKFLVEHGARTSR